MKFFTTLLTLFTLILTAPGAQAQSAPSVDLLWSASTYKPAFYLGHSQATPQSTVRVVALAAWPGVSPEQLEYRWQRDGQAVPKSSGLGQSTLSFTAGQARERHQVQVLVTAPGKTGSANRLVEILVVNPVISIYEDDPLLGINYHRALGTSLTLTQPEINLAAEPYFFNNVDVQTGKIDYRWTLNDQKVVPSPVDNRLITFAAPSGISGESIIKLTTESLNNLFQTAKREFRINFGNTGVFNF